jgi:hypothetical protein
MKNALLLLFLILSMQSGIAQGIRYSLNEEKGYYVQFKGLCQVWLRHTDLNPGSTVNGYSVDNYSDISIRRLRFQVFGQLSERVFFYSQFGQNNYNFMSPQFEGAFFHDATLEYYFSRQLHVGGGLTAWNGLLRNASPSIGTIMPLVVPSMMCK